MLADQVAFGATGPATPILQHANPYGAPGPAIATGPYVHPAPYQEARERLQRELEASHSSKKQELQVSSDSVPFNALDVRLRAEPPVVEYPSMLLMCACVPNQQW